MSKIQDLIAEMTLEEKASLCSGLNFWYLKGIDRLGIPSIMVTDGPHGLRKQSADSAELGLHQSVPATCFPTASALAATWNRDLIYQVGQALGEECLQEKVGVLLGPGANIKRSPLCGRNFEYFSEDPYLSGEIAKSHINGVQSNGVGTSLKHYSVNNQEYRRMSIDAIVDERALREIYLAGFESAVRDAQPWTIMGAYNRVNGTYSCEHPIILHKILREEWGFEGVAITDWGAMNERVDALKAGLDLEMPGPKLENDQKLVSAVQNGDLDEKVLDAAVERILKIIFQAEAALENDFTYSADTHHALARKVAGEGAVLLKNENEALPLKKNAKIALIGAFAKFPRYQGAGSSLINPSRICTLYQEIVDLAGEANIVYAPGYSLSDDVVDDELIQEALKSVEDADVVVINAGLPASYEAEGFDRTHLQMPANHNKLIEQISSAHKKVVVVLSNGAPVEMPWIANVSAVLESYLGGQAGAGGVADVLFGIVNPSGKIAETFPLKLEDTPCFAYFPGGPRTVEYRESLYVGYRFYNTVEKEVLFPFGYGLSYTDFEYSGLELSTNQLIEGDSLTVKLKMKNTGAFAGKEVVQIYVHPVDSSVFRPQAELKGFTKVDLEAGEEKEIAIALDSRAFAYFSTAVDDWYVESGEYQIWVGASSQDIRLKGEVRVTSTQPDVVPSERDQVAAYRNFSNDGKISEKDFEALLGRPVPSNSYPEGEKFTVNTSIADMRGTKAGDQFNEIIKDVLNAMNIENPDDPNSQMMITMVREGPPRVLMMFGSPEDREKIKRILKNQ